MTNFDSGYLYWLFMSAIISAVIAVTMNNSLHHELPDVKSYKWGYFTGWAGVLNGVFFAIVSFIDAMNVSIYSDKKTLFFFLGVYLLVAAVAHIFVIKRNKWGWIISIILQLNPLLWIINGIYLKNRWNEMSGMNVPEALNTLGLRFRKLSLPNRSLIAGSAFWVLVVLTFVLLIPV